MELLNPKKKSFDHFDARTRDIMLKTISFFENRGKKKLKDDDREYVWYADFLDFIKQEKVFYTFLTPSQYGEKDCRWDTLRNSEYSEILGFYGLCYWYTWQVTILGLGPIWMSANEKVKKKTAQLLKEGAIFGFGLSEKEHGADIYTTDMIVTRQSDGSYRATGGKYYIGNGNKAAFIATFGQLADTKEYIFFVAKTAHENYEDVQSVVNSQSYVAEFKLHDYPLTEDDFLLRGDAAWDASLNTVNVGKFNLGWATIGIATHAFHEAINHASKRRLYNTLVTDFPHIKQFFTDGYARLMAMKLFATRAVDYMKSATLEDRRYLLYNPMNKMKVTSQGEVVVDELWEVIAAKGFEKDMYFDMATRDIRALPKLEGTVHVNMALVVKFLANYLFKPDTNLPKITRQDSACDDLFLFAQGPARGLGKIRFHDYMPAYDSIDQPNVRIFKEQMALFKQMLMTAAPDEKQMKDIDFLLILGELFTLIAYGQIIIESSEFETVDTDLLDQIFDFMIRDFSKYALALYHKPSSREAQMQCCLNMIKKPEVDPARFERVWQKVKALEDSYEMTP